MLEFISRQLEISTCFLNLHLQFQPSQSSIFVSYHHSCTITVPLSPQYSSYHHTITGSTQMECFRVITLPLAPDPTATTVACSTFPWDFSGIMIPPLVTVSAAHRSTSTRSKRGRNFLNAFPACGSNCTLERESHYNKKSN